MEFVVETIIAAVGGILLARWVVKNAQKEFLRQLGGQEEKNKQG